MNFYYNVKPLSAVAAKQQAIVGQFAWNIILFAGIALVVAAIFMIIRSVRRRAQGPPNAYEPFQAADGRLVAIRTRINDLQAAAELVQTALDDMNDAAEETCNIMKEVEQVYVGNSAAPTDEAEFNLPAAQQQQRRKDRERRAQLRFAEERKLFAAVTKKPILECFASSDEDIAAAEQELSTLVEEITSLLDNAEVKVAIEKRERIRSLLNFNARYLKKAVNAATAEGFWADLKGAALLSKADELLGKAKTIYNEIQTLKRDVKLQRQVANQLTKKATNLGNGEFSEGDIRMGMAAATGGN